MNVPGKRLILGAAVAVAALGVGGIAYASTDDPAPEQGYVTVEDGATTPSPGNPQQNGTRGDCPEKNGLGHGEGQGEGQGEQPSQPQTQPEQTEPEQTEPEQTEPEQTQPAQPDAAGNA